MQWQCCLMYVPVLLLLLQVGAALLTGLRRRCS
jgi:hypothetical protein